MPRDGRPLAVSSTLTAMIGPVGAGPTPVSGLSRGVGFGAGALVVGLGVTLVGAEEEVTTGDGGAALFLSPPASANALTAAAATTITTPPTTNSWFLDRRPIM